VSVRDASSLLCFMQDAEHGAVSSSGMQGYEPMPDEDLDPQMDAQRRLTAGGPQVGAAT
jgi:hypothetical protein